jgi:2-C-methyl-D-erythritol 4-phosphate cytidylyltransferase
MLTNFEDAKETLESVKKDSNEYKKIIFDLGLKALEENSKWVVLHDSVRVKPSLD